MPGSRCPRPALPILRWLPRYSRAWLPLDLLAGLAVGLTTVPQALAYAELAGLPLQVGARARVEPGTPAPEQPAACGRADLGWGTEGWHCALAHFPGRVPCVCQGPWSDPRSAQVSVLSQLPGLCQCPFCPPVLSQGCAIVPSVPLQYGLYSSFMGCFVYCFLGTAKDVTLGPTAIMSLLVSSYASHEPVHAVLLAFLSGCIQLAMGLLHLGELLLLCTDVCLGCGCTVCSCSSLLSALRDTAIVLLMHVTALCTHTRLCWVLTASHPMQDSFWISFPSLSLKGSHQLLPSPLASTRSR